MYDICYIDICTCTYAYNMCMYVYICISICIYNMCDIYVHKIRIYYMRCLSLI